MKISISQCTSCSLSGLQVVPTSVTGLKKKFLAMECQQRWACVHGIAWRGRGSAESYSERYPSDLIFCVGSGSWILLVFRCITLNKTSSTFFSFYTSKIAHSFSGGEWIMQRGFVATTLKATTLKYFTDRISWDVRYARYLTRYLRMPPFERVPEVSRPGAFQNGSPFKVRLHCSRPGWAEDFENLKGWRLRDLSRSLTIWSSLSECLKCTGYFFGLFCAVFPQALGASTLAKSSTVPELCRHNNSCGCSLGLGADAGSGCCSQSQPGFSWNLFSPLCLFCGWYEVRGWKERKVGVENVREGKDELSFLMQCWQIQFKPLAELQLNSVLSSAIK